MDELLKKQLKITACKVRMGIIEGCIMLRADIPEDRFPLRMF